MGLMESRGIMTVEFGRVPDVIFRFQAESFSISVEWVVHLPFPLV